MKAKRLYVVVTPKGQVSESTSFHEDLCKAAYVNYWMPPGVQFQAREIWALWSKFQEAGYNVVEIPIPEDLEGKDVCHT